MSAAICSEPIPMAPLLDAIFASHALELGFGLGFGGSACKKMLPGKYGYVPAGGA
jgi:hypothetical protein